MARMLSLTVALFVAVSSLARADTSSAVLDGTLINAIKTVVQQDNVEQGRSSAAVPQGESTRIWFDNGRYVISLDGVSDASSRAYEVSSERRTAQSTVAPRTAPAIAIDSIVFSALVAANAQFDSTVSLDTDAQAQRADGAFTESYVSRANYVLVNVSYPGRPQPPLITSIDGCSQYAHAYRVDKNTLSIRELKPVCS